MTKSEAKDILNDRLDFRVSGATPVSGRYFEGEHAIVLLENIRSSQEDIDITDGNFDAYLITLKNDLAYQVLSDVFDKDEIDDDLLDFYPALFDNLLSMRMAIKVINIIIAATRSNRIQSINEESVKMIYFDVNGENGFLNRYDAELQRVKNRTGNQQKMTTITTG